MENLCVQTVPWYVNVQVYSVVIHYTLCTYMCLYMPIEHIYNIYGICSMKSMIKVKFSEAWVWSGSNIASSSSSSMHQNEHISQFNLKKKTYTHIYLPWSRLYIEHASRITCGRHSFFSLNTRGHTGVNVSWADWLAGWLASNIAIERYLCVSYVHECANSSTMQYEQKEC